MCQGQLPWPHERSRRGVGAAVLAGTRAARTHRCAHPLHAPARTGQGLGLLRRRRAPLAHHLPRGGDRTARGTPGVRGAGLHGDALSPQAGHGALAERLVGRVRRPYARLSAHRDLLPRAGGGGVRARRARRRGTGVQGSCAGGGVRPGRSAARPGVGHARRERHARRHPLRLGTRAGHVHRAGAGGAGTGPSSPAAPDRRAHGAAGVRGLPGAGGTVRGGAPGHHDGLHRLHREPVAVSPGGAGQAGRAGGPGAVRERLPQHSVRIPACAGRPDADRPGRGVAARGLLRERGAAVRDRRLFGAWGWLFWGVGALVLGGLWWFGGFGVWGCFGA